MGQPNPTGSRVRVSLGLGAGHGESTHDPGPTHLKGNSQRRPTAANEGQCRPTKTKKGPNDARRVVWAIGRSFFSMYILFLIFLLLRSPRRPTAANDGQRRSTKAHSSQRSPMQAHEDEKGPKLGLSFFKFIFYFLFFYY